jgi:hypothetical protein
MNEATPVEQWAGLLPRATLLDDRFHETSPLQLVPLARKTLLFRRPDMIRILEAPD